MTSAPHFSPTQQIILGFDPGRDKCGLAVMELNELHYHQVVPAEKAIATIQALCQKFSISLLVIGDQTTAKRWKEQLSHELPTLSIVMVDERYSSLEARDRYWQMYPPQRCLKVTAPKPATTTTTNRRYCRHAPHRKILKKKISES